MSTVFPLSNMTTAENTTVYMYVTHVIFTLYLLVLVHVFIKRSAVDVCDCRRGATLLIHEARLDDAGAYSCLVTNVLGSAVSATNHVIVAEPGRPLIELVSRDSLQFCWLLVRIYRGLSPRRLFNVQQLLPAVYLRRNQWQLK